MVFTLLIQAQEAIEAIGGFRDDPPTYALLVILILGNIIQAGVIVYLFKRIEKKEDEKFEISKKGMEAMASISPMIANVTDARKEDFRRFEAVLKEAMESFKERQVEAVGQLKEHIITITNLTK